MLAAFSPTLYDPVFGKHGDATMKRYGRNIPLEYLYVSLGSFNLTHGLWMIYLASQGFSLVQLGILEALYHVTSFLMEVPTGAVADLWGRKASRICGRVIACFSLLVMFFGKVFWVQSMAFILTALGNNLESGSGDALVYDSLLLDDREDRYMRVAGKRELIFQSTAIVAYAFGGYLALRSYAAVYAVSMACFALAALCAFFFREPKVHVPVLPEARGRSMGSRILGSMKDQLSQSLRIMRERKKIGFFIVFSEILFCFITVLFFYLQNHWISLGWSEWEIGLVFCANAAVAGLIALRSSSLERKIGERGVLTFLPIALVLCLWGVALTRFAHLFFIFLGTIEGLLIIAIGTYLNRLIPSAQRATILSFQSMAFSLFMMVLFPLVGVVGDRWSLPVAFVAMSTAASLLCLLYLILYRLLGPSC